ncbi:MAG: hypothetical protein QOE60_647 [Thermoleophilaceae bacterium]|nr:hypothetical protein [Thermoleophilaceae bacterium]
MLAAAAALIVLAGGAAAAWVAASDDDNGSPFTRSVAGDPAPRASVPTQTAEPPATTTEPQPQAPEPNLDPNATPNDQPTGKARKTRFPRERTQKSNNDPPQRVFTVPPAREFTGTGNAALGTVDVSTPSIVKWTTKGRFELRFGRESFPIIAPSPSGQLVVPPYNFERVRVIARGRWKITIRPQQ